MKDKIQTERAIIVNHLNIVMELKKTFFLLPVFSTLFINCGQVCQNDFVNGGIERVESEILGQERVLYVYLPAEYDLTEASYPVHYLTDAPLSANIYHNLLRLHSLAESMPKSIVVGLSSDGREYHLHPEKGAAKYLEFIKKEVIPFVEKKYRVEPFRTISGHSLGGGFAIYAFLFCPDLFNACIAGSPHPIGYLADAVSGDNFSFESNSTVFLYSSIGTVDDINRLLFEDFKKLITEKAPQNLKFHFQINEGENHFSNLPVNFQDGLEKLYSKQPE